MILEELDRISCEHIEHIIISHSDKDHAGGAPVLILDDSRTVGTVWFNPDGLKDSDIWERLLRAVHTRVRRCGLDGHQMIHTETGQQLTCGRARLEVIHPSIMMAGSGPTARSALGRLYSNTLSVVVRVHLTNRPVALLAADMDNKALAHIQENGWELSAPVLVFPHHGGSSGGKDPQRFAQLLTSLVQPDLVIFSIKSMLRPANPDPRNVAAVRSAAPSVHIACTQLSVHCHSQDSVAPDEHLGLRPAAGRKGGRCCAGSITIWLEGDSVKYDPPLDNHRSFVESFVTSPICMRTPSAEASKSANSTN